MAIPGISAALMTGGRIAGGLAGMGRAKGMIAGLGRLNLPARFGNAALEMGMFTGLGMGIDALSRMGQSQSQPLQGTTVDGNDAYYQALEQQRRQINYSQPPMGW